jgi:hypothetical protein
MTMGLNGLNNRPWRGAKREKLSVQRFVLAKATREAQQKCFDRSWAYSLVRFWGFEARTKNEYTMDDFSMLTIREPWLLKRKVSTSIASTWLAGKEFMLQDRRDSRQGTNLSEISNRPLQRRKAKDRVPTISCTDNGFVRKLQNRLAHTFTYFANFEVLTTHCFESALLFKVDAMHMLVRYGAHDAR